MPPDPDELAAAVVHNVANYVERELAPLRERLALLEAQPAARDGRDGMPGRDGDKGADGKDGKDGRDGKDGVSFEDVSEELADDGRTIVRSYRRPDGEPVVFRHTTAIPLDRGVWKANTEYLPGDGVTWGGCFWIAQKVTTSQPHDGASIDSWRLAVKKGRDGRDGKDGQKGDPGLQGRPGRDLTQLGQDGSKW